MFWGFVRPAGDEPSSASMADAELGPGWISDGPLHVAGVGPTRLAGSAGGVRALALARFDDRSELSARLGLSAESTDAELVLEAYRRWGGEFASNLRGDFAAVVWDPSGDELLCAVDIFGIGSLFVVEGRGALRGFSSQLSRVRALPMARPQLDLEVVGRYVCQLPIAPERTSFVGVHRVGPGSLVSVRSDGRPRARRYWSLAEATPVRLRRDEDYLEAFRERLDRAVERRLVGARVALSLSAGLDSTAILGAASALGRGGDVLALTGTPRQAACNEYAQAAQLCAALGTRSLAVDPETTLEGFSEACRISAEPRYLTHFPITLAITRRAAREGAERLLAGMYGDLVGGTVWPRALFVHLLRSGHVRAWLREIRQLPRRGRPRMALASVLGALPWIDEARKGRRIDELVSSGFPVAGIRPKAWAELGFEGVRRGFVLEVDGWMREFAARRAWLEWSLMFESEFAGRVAAELGLELAHPFADRELVSLSLSLPATVLSRRALIRAPLRHAMRGRVPDAVRLRRHKVVFDDMYQAMIAELGPELARRPQASALEPLLCWPAVQEALVAAKSHPEHLHAWRCLAVNAWVLDHEGSP